MRNGILLGSATVALVALWFATEREHSQTRTPPGLIGLDVCQHYVRERLHKPESGKFQPSFEVAEHLLSGDPKTLRYDSYIDALDRSGQMKRETWSCTVRADDPKNGRWTVLALALSNLH